MGVSRHTHRPLMGVCVCFVLGIIGNEYIQISFGVSALLTAGLMFLSVFIRQRKLSVVFLLSGITFLGGIYSKDYQTSPPNHICHIFYRYYKDPVVIEGMVISDVEKRSFFKKKKTVFTLDVKRLKSKWGWQEKQGRILVNIFREEDVNYGDYLVLEGKLHRPFDFSKDSQFSYKDYLYHKGITFIFSIKKDGYIEALGRNKGNFIKKFSFQIKHKLTDVIRSNLSKGEAGIIQAFLLGDRYDIPKNVYELFRLSGVAHIIAISGFNIGIVAQVIFLILKMLSIPRKGQYVLTMAFLIFYAFLTGGQPPVVRATIMAVIFLTSFLIEREPEPVNTLSAAALVLLVMNPLNLFDVGFQLSFISVLSIILFYQRFMEVFYKWAPVINEKQGDKYHRKDALFVIKFWTIRYFFQSMAVSLSAYLGVFALVVYYFQLITPIVIIANLVVIPLASLIILVGMGLLTVGVLCPFVAAIFANCIKLLLNIMVVSLVLFVQIPGVYFKVTNLSLPIVFLYYLLAVLFLYGPTFIKPALYLTYRKVKHFLKIDKN